MSNLLIRLIRSNEISPYSVIISIMEFPILVACSVWYGLFSAKNFNSSSIQGHFNLEHPSDPISFYPDSFECQNCEKNVKVLDFDQHLTQCSLFSNENFEFLLQRVACLYCNRNFAIDRIEKHQQVCENLFKKRNYFEKSKSPKESHSTIKLKHKLNLNYPNSKWQKQHLDLIKKLRIDENLENYDDYITCPYCFRRFAPIPAEKHIIACKDIIHKPKPPPSKLGILPKLYDRNISVINEQIKIESNKQSPRNYSFSGLKPSKKREKSLGTQDGGVTERVLTRENRKSKEIVEYSINQKLRGKRKNEPRSKSIYKISSNVCKCGEVFHSRAIYCMMCGSCKYK